MNSSPYRTTTQKTREIWLDITRILACFLVCLIHAPIPNVGNSPIWLQLYTFIAKPCNAIFFMISGALLFPIKAPLNPYVCKKLKRLAVPIAFWSLVAIGIHVTLGQMTAQEAWEKVFLIPFVKVEGVYWFMYALLGLSLFAPLISPAIEKLPYLKYFLLLWTVTLCLPIANLIIPGAYFLESYTSLYSSFGGFLGYMLLGYYMRFHLPDWRKCLPWLILGGLLTFGWSLACHLFSIKGAAYGNLDLNTAIAAAIIFLCCKWAGTLFTAMAQKGSAAAKLHATGSRLLLDVSQQTFGIYLIHIFVMRDGVWAVWEHFFPEVTYAIQIPAVATSTFLLSYLIIKLLRLIPGTRYIL